MASCRPAEAGGVDGSIDSTELGRVAVARLEDIAQFVGHAKPATTAGYVKRLGRRPDAVAKRAAAVLDVQTEQNGSDE